VKFCLNAKFFAIIFALCGRSCKPLSFTSFRSWDAYQGKKVSHDEAAAKGLIESTGYHRRGPEIRLLEQILAARS
jgi:hypothetical protein